MTPPLTGVRVVSLATNLPGPLAAARLAALGAHVTKVEPPQGDPLAMAATEWYAELVAQQTVTTIDVKTDRATLDGLLSDADLLITSMRPSALRRLQLDRPHEQFPQLSLVEIVGHPGDKAEVPGHDLNYQAVHGTLLPPQLPTVPIADMLGAERAVSAALTALLVRNRTGQGQAHRVVLEDAAAWAADGTRHLTGPGTLLGGVFPGYGLYACADGYVALGAVEPHFFTAAMNTFGVDGTHSGFAKAFAERTVAELEAMATRADVPLNRVNSAVTERHS